MASIFNKPPEITTDEINFLQDDTHREPLDGQAKLYVKSDGQLYFENDSGGDDVLIGGGAEALFTDGSNKMDPGAAIGCNFYQGVPNLNNNISLFGTNTTINAQDQIILNDETVINDNLNVVNGGTIFASDIIGNVQGTNGLSLNSVNLTLNSGVGIDLTANTNAKEGLTVFNTKPVFLGTGAQESVLLTNATGQVEADALVGGQFSDPLVSKSSVEQHYLVGANPASNPNIVLGSTGLVNTNGTDNIAIAENSLRVLQPGSIRNISIGRASLYDLGVGNSNTTIGQQCGSWQTTGDKNTYIGSQAGDQSVYTSGDKNTFIGSDSGTTTNNSQYRIALGHKARATQNQQCMIGSSTASENITEIVSGIASTCSLGSVSLPYNNIHLSGNVVSSSGLFGGQDVVTHVQDDTKHRIINDTAVSTTELWSSSKINSVVGAIPSGLVYQGSWNALTNTPTLTSSVGISGYYFIVSVGNPALAPALDGITEVGNGDWIIFSSTGVWQKMDNSDQVSSVAGKQGAVVLDTADIVSGQFADARISKTSTDQHYILNTNTALGNNITTAGGTRKVAIGNNALRNLTGGDANTAIGNNSGDQQTSGQFNTYIGGDSGSTMVTGNYNSFFGHGANGLSGGSYQIALGRNATCSANRQMTLGGSTLATDDIVEVVAGIDNNTSLGTVARRWADFHTFNSNVVNEVVAASILPFITNVATIGSTGNIFNQLHVRQAIFGSTGNTYSMPTTSGTTGEVLQLAGGGVTFASKNVINTGGNSYTLPTTRPSDDQILTCTANSGTLEWGQISGGTGITIDDTGNNYVFNNDNPTVPSLASGVGAGESLVSDGVGPDFTVKTIEAGTNITVVDNTDRLTISNSMTFQTVELNGITNIADAIQFTDANNIAIQLVTSGGGIKTFKRWQRIGNCVTLHFMTRMEEESKTAFTGTLTDPVQIQLPHTVSHLTTGTIQRTNHNNDGDTANHNTVGGFIGLHIIAKGGEAHAKIVRENRLRSDPTTSNPALDAFVTVSEINISRTRMYGQISYFTTDP